MQLTISDKRLVSKAVSTLVLMITLAAVALFLSHARSLQSPQVLGISIGR